MRNFLTQIFQPKPALSLVELLVALTILALLSTAGLKMFQSTQKSFVDGRTSLAKAKRNEAIAAFIYGDFTSNALPISDEPQLYTNSAMPADLQAAEKLAVATIFGTGSRFQFAVPKCALAQNADPDIGVVRFPADCITYAQTTIAERMNRLLSSGVKIVFAIDGTNTRCSISRSLENTGNGDVATAYVDDKFCLRMANEPQNVPRTGSHIMFPRFVVSNNVAPASFHTSFIENTGESTTGLKIEAPDRIKIRGDEENFITSIDLFTRDPSADVGVVLSLGDRFGTINVGTRSQLPADVDVINNGTSLLSLNGPVGSIRTALASLFYQPPANFLVKKH